MRARGFKMSNESFYDWHQSVAQTNQQQTQTTTFLPQEHAQMEAVLNEVKVVENQY